MTIHRKQGGPGRNVAGLTVLMLAVAVLVVVPRSITPGIAGLGRPAVLPPAPAVGSCLTQAVQVVDCSLTHRWEVTGSWAATDLARSAEATVETCQVRSNSYGEFGAIRTFGRWSVRLAIVTAVIQAPNGQRAGPNGWAACTIQPAWVDARAGALAEVSDPGDAPEVFGICLDYVAGNGGVDCGRVHNVQLFGTAGPSGGSAAGNDDLRDCERLAAWSMGVMDPTYGGQLLIRSDTGSGGGQAELRCFAVPAAGRLLTGSLSGLAGRPLPLL